MKNMSYKLLFAITLLTFAGRDARAFSVSFDTIKQRLGDQSNDPVAVDQYFVENAQNISLATYLEFLFREANEQEDNSTLYLDFMKYMIAVAGLPKYRRDLFEKALRYAKKESTLWEKTKHVAYSTATGAAAGGLGGALLGPTGEFIKNPQYQLQSSENLGRFFKGKAPESALRFGVAGAGLGGAYGFYRGVTTRNHIGYRLPRYSQPILERIGLTSRRKGTQ